MAADLLNLPNGVLVSIDLGHPCPGCGLPLPERPRIDGIPGLGAPYDDSVFVTALRRDGSACTSGEFCSTACIVRFLREGDRSKLRWFTRREIRRSSFAGCDERCDCECPVYPDTVYHRRPRSHRYLLAYGFYGSPVDGGSVFCSIDCALLVFEKFAAHSG